MTEQELKDILWTCKSQNPDEPIDPKGLYCDNLDIIEFAGKLLDVLALDGLKYARAERAECIKFVRSLNSEVARALSEKRGPM